MSENIAQVSLHGRRMGVSRLGNLVANDIAISRPCVNATIAIGDESSNARTITIQLLDADGKDIDYVETFELIVFGNAAKTAGSSGGSTGVAIGTDGAIIATAEAKKWFLCTSESDGDWDGTYTDTGTDAAYLGVRLPNGRIVMSAAMTNA